MSEGTWLSGRPGRSAEDMRALFGHGRKSDSDSFNAAMREAQARPSRSALFTSAGTEFVLLQSPDDGLWHYRPTQAERARLRAERKARERSRR
jgi:hypothetical protein